MPLSGCFVIVQLGLATINLPTKCEVFISAHYEDINKFKMWKMDGLG